MLARAGSVAGRARRISGPRVGPATATAKGRSSRSFFPSPSTARTLPFPHHISLTGALRESCDAHAWGSPEPWAGTLPHQCWEASTSAGGAHAHAHAGAGGSSGAENAQGRAEWPALPHDVLQGVGVHLAAADLCAARLACRAWDRGLSATLQHLQPKELRSAEIVERCFCSASRGVGKKRRRRLMFALVRRLGLPVLFPSLRRRAGFRACSR